MTAVHHLLGVCLGVLEEVVQLLECAAALLQDALVHLLSGKVAYCHTVKNYIGIPVLELSILPLPEIPLTGDSKDL